MHWRITEDHLDFDTSRVGTYNSDDGENGIFEAVEVRLLDDDRIHYYTAVCENTEESLVNLFQWAQYDAGVTILQLQNKETGKWVDEIS